MTRTGLWTSLLLAVTVPTQGCSAGSSPPNSGPLALEASIPLPGVAGRIDHLAYDAKRGRLYVAALGNGTVEAIDVAGGRSAGRISGLKEPQGLAFLPAQDELAVASGGDGTVRFYRGADLAPSGVLTLGGDADNLRVQSHTGRLVVGYGAGALAIIDPTNHTVMSRTPLPAHPEGFQLNGDQAVVNLPDTDGIAVVDLAAGKTLATWRNPGLKWNYPLAIDPAAGLIAVAYRFPARLALWDLKTGAVKQRLHACGDADDVFFDAPRHRLYVICGSGGVDVFATTGGDYARQGATPTRSGARTGLFVPQIDRLFVAARADSGAEAAILVFKP